jgi:hypothetical protein
MQSKKQPRHASDAALEGLLYKKLRAKFGPEVTITFKFLVNMDVLTFEVSDHGKSVSNAITGLEILQSNVLEHMIDSRVNHVYEQFQELK